MGIFPAKIFAINCDIHEIELNNIPRFAIGRQQRYVAMQITLLKIMENHSFTLRYFSISLSHSRPRLCHFHPNFLPRFVRSDL